MYNGLTNKEVELKKKNNQINNKKVRYSRSIKSILIENIFTFFNLINFSLFILVLLTGSYLNGLFILVLILNTSIATIGEIKAKMLIEKISLTNQVQVTVIRDNIETLIDVQNIVQDDLIVLKSGDTLPVDAKVISSNLCEVDESIITGESNNILKHPNDLIISGSIVLSGNAKVQVTAINNQNYANKLIEEANLTEHEKTYLQKSINKILKVITIFIIPTMILLFIKQFFFTDLTWQQAILKTVAGVNGMIPGGIVLLTSVALATGTIQMIKKRVIIQKLNGIETLSCVNTLCLDKTGTITDGTLKVIDVINLTKIDIGNVVKNMLNNDLVNVTDQALDKYFKLTNKLNIKKKVPFSSSRKYSLVTFDKEGTYVLGALEYIIDQNESYQKYIAEYLNKGYRVITLVHSKDKDFDKLPSSLKVVGFIILKDNLRPNIKNTLAYFTKENIKLKIISGDNPKTVANVLRQVDFPHCDNYLDCQDITNFDNYVTKYDVFGRTTPYQKKLIIKSLKKSSTVGMIGDGVNDILALKEADCSIALASGINAARSVSQVVLLDSDFTVLPNILKEGRRVVNNVSRVANLYLVKTLYSFLFSLLSILFNFPYPFYPIQLSIISTLCVGIPSYLVTLTKDYRPVTKDFLENILKNIIPYGLTIVINTIIIVVMSLIFKTDYNNYNIVIVTMTGILNILLLYNIVKPTNNFLKYALATCLALFILTLTNFNYQLLLADYNIINILLVIIFFIIDLYFIKYLTNLYYLIYYKIKKNE